MKIFNFVLLLIVAALYIQASMDEADLAEIGGEDESAGLGRRGGQILTTSGSFVLSANRAGNDEEELGEEDGLDELLFRGRGGATRGGATLRRAPPKILPGQCHKELFVPHESRGTNGVVIPAHTRYGCKTCSSPADRSVRPDHKPHEQCTSCGTTKIGNEVHDLFLVAKKFKVHEGKHVLEGTCELLPPLGEFNPSSKSVCKDTPCTDGSTGFPIGSGVNGKPYSSTDKTVCSRLCLLGGALTRQTKLERYDNPEKSTGKRQMDAKFSLLVDPFNGKWIDPILFKHKMKRAIPASEPVCGLHKTVMCTKNKHYDLVKCEKSGKPTHCKKENCTVEKNVHCVAILPQKDENKPLLNQGFMNTKGLNGASRTGVKSHKAYTNECKYAINPCNLVALYV